LSANSTKTRQTTFGKETVEQKFRRRLQEPAEEGEGCVEGSTARFLIQVPPQADISDLPALWEIYIDEYGGEEQ